MSEIGHEEAYSELAAVALDAVPAGVGDAVRAHAAVCPECGPELAAMEETVATLGQLAPPAAMNPGRSAGIRSRLVMRARSERETKSAPVSGRPDLSRGVASLTGLGHKATPAAQRIVSGESKRVTPAQPAGVTPIAEAPSRRMSWVALAAAAALVAMGAQLLRVTADRNAMRDRLVAADTLAPLADSLSAALNEKDAIIRALAGADVKVVALTAEGEQQPTARMTWNRESNDWIMFAYGLKQPSPGKTYQVWLVTDNAKISAGTFRPDKDGKTVLHANYALPRDALRAVAITEEPEGGVPAPTGPMVVVGPA